MESLYFDENEDSEISVTFKIPISIPSIKILNDIKHSKILIKNFEIFYPFSPSESQIKFMNNILDFLLSYKKGLFILEPYIKKNICLLCTLISYIIKIKKKIYFVSTKEKNLKRKNKIESTSYRPNIVFINNKEDINKYKQENIKHYFHIMFISYEYFLDEDIRNKLELKLDNNIIVYNDFYQIDEICKNIMNFEIDIILLQNNLNELKNLKNNNKIDNIEILKNEINILSNIIDNIKKKLNIKNDYLVYNIFIELFFTEEKYKLNELLSKKNLSTLTFVNIDYHIKYLKDLKKQYNIDIKYFIHLLKFLKKLINNNTNKKNYIFEINLNKIYINCLNSKIILDNLYDNNYISLYITNKYIDKSKINCDFIYESKAKFNNFKINIIPSDINNIIDLGIKIKLYLSTINNKNTKTFLIFNNYHFRNKCYTLWIENKLILGKKFILYNKNLNKDVTYNNNIIVGFFYNQKEYINLIDNNVKLIIFIGVNENEKEDIITLFNNDLIDIIKKIKEYCMLLLIDNKYNEYYENNKYLLWIKNNINVSNNNDLLYSELKDYFIKMNKSYPLIDNKENENDIEEEMFQNILGNILDGNNNNKSINLNNTINNNNQLKLNFDDNLNTNNRIKNYCTNLETYKKNQVLGKKRNNHSNIDEITREFININNNNNNNTDNNNQNDIENNNDEKKDEDINNIENENLLFVKCKGPFQCPICFKFSNENPDLVYQQSKCRHILCSICWKEWLHEKLECPLCKHKVRAKTLSNVIEIKDD